MARLRHNRGYSSSFQCPPWDEGETLCKHLNHLRHRIGTFELNDVEIFYPFLQTIRAKDVSAAATEAALQGIIQMLNVHPWSTGILRQIAEGVIECRFEESTRDFDDCVLIQSLHVLRQCFRTCDPSIGKIAFTHLLEKYHPENPVVEVRTAFSTSLPSAPSTILQFQAGNVLNEFVAKANGDFLLFLVEWGLKEAKRPSVTPTRLKLAVTALRQGMEHYNLARRKKETGPFLDRLGKLVHLIPWSILMALRISTNIVQSYCWRSVNADPSPLIPVVRFNLEIRKIHKIRLTARI